MKSKDWLTRISTVGFNTVLSEFAEETRLLAAERTSRSNNMTKGHALDGALREQRQKWNAISRQIPELPAFENVLTALPQLKTEHDKFLNRGKQEGEVALQEEGTKPKPKISGKKYPRPPAGGPGRTLVVPERS